MPLAEEVREGIYCNFQVFFESFIHPPHKSVLYFKCPWLKEIKSKKKKILTKLRTFKVGQRKSFYIAQNFAQLFMNMTFSSYIFFNLMHYGRCKYFLRDNLISECPYLDNLCCKAALFVSQTSFHFLIFGWQNPWNSISCMIFKILGQGWKGWGGTQSGY